MSGFSRVSISESLRRTIDDIKEIAGQHSDEDIYAMLKDCNMDPNETAQKLLYLDTFHEVKRKRDRRKVRQGTRGGGNQYSSYNSAGGRQLNVRQENCYSSSKGRDSKSSVAVVHKESNKAPAITGSISAANGSSVHELRPQSAEQNKGVSKDTKTDCDDMPKKSQSLRPVTVKQYPNVDPGPTPTSTPTVASTAATARTQGGSLKPKSSQVGNSVGLYSSATDPVLVPSLNPRNPGSVGIIKRETGNQRNAAETSGNPVDDCRMNAVHNVTFGQGVEISHEAESSRLPTSTSHHTAAAAAAKGNQETCLVQPDNAPLKEMPEAVEDPISEQTTSEADIKLHTSARKSVIFPNHLHVPEAFKNSLTFGSLEASLGQNNDSSPSDASFGTNNEVSKEPSVICRPQSSSSISGCSDYHDRPPSPPRVLVDIKPSPENASSGTSLRYDQPKQEMLQPVGGSHNPPVPPTTPDYGLNLIPPVVGPHPAQLEGLETQGGNSNSNSVAQSSSTPSMTQPRGISQSSIAVSPQMFPFLRQTYPPNYIPYNPYFSQLYMPPQNTHQLLSHTAFPHQPSPGNMYMPPTAATSGVKFPVPPVYKPGNVAGNMTHYGISPGYGSYGTSGLGYGSSGPLPPQTSSNDDMAPPELKDKNIYSTIKQNEDLHVLSCASGHDPSALQTNVLYNLPQAQAVAAYQAGHSSYGGMYHHPSQSMPARSLVHQAQPPGAAMEPAVSSYSQPQQPQLLPLPQQQYGQMNWNQKFFNRENV
ncbi:flocculation protein [Perilla frutescens var. hirtella]|nr:flocculation protein [Perilla frutescens var. frutescens]KAH6786283.1 flocculation protein [Perilla frutescens var. hirtella]